MLDFDIIPRSEMAAALARYPANRSADGCLLWDGPKRPAGYGLTRVRGKVESAHRIACFLGSGKPPQGRNDACHRCDTPACIEPAHLYWGSRSRNMRDAHDRGRLRYQQDSGVLPRGEDHGRARLTKADIELIITSPLSTVELARKLNYDRSNILKIRKGMLWRSTVAALRALKSNRDTHHETR